MYDNYNYPLGADNPSAPWNQIEEQEPKEAICNVSFMLRKEDEAILTDDYIATEWEDAEVDDEGRICRSGGVEYDFSEADLEQAYKYSEYNILCLLDELKKRVSSEISALQARLSEETSKPTRERLKRNVAHLRNILFSCNGWEMDDVEVELNN